VFAVGLLLWVVYLWGLQEPRADQHLRGAEPEGAPRSVLSASRREAMPPRAKPVHTGPTLPALRTADLIADIQVDEPRVCAGESFLVKILGKPENAHSSLPIAELNFNIGGRFGTDIAITPQAAGSEQYTVVASNGVDKVEHRTFSVEVLPRDAPECGERSIVSLSVERAKFDSDVVVARVIAHHGLVAPIQYRWSFGDGSGVETTGAMATHDYALRDQSRSLSTYLVSVRASDARGRTAEGRATIHLTNNHYRARMFGSRLVQAVYDRFPAPVAGGYRVDVAFRSFEPEPVSWERAKLTERSCLAGQRDRTHEIAAAELTDELRVDPGRASQRTLRVPTAWVGEDTCAIALELTGDTVPPRTGQQLPNSPIKLQSVMSRINLEIRAAPSAAQGGAPTLARRAVRDPALLKKLRRAVEVLGSDRITPAQLERLERDGTLQR
jgi:hypothetical protein